MENLTKWGIDCQICPKSLTIVYSEAEKEDPGKIKDHLAELMLYHLKHFRHHHSATIETNEYTLEVVRKWVVRLKPPGYEHTG